MPGRESWLKVGLKTASFSSGLRQMKGMAQGAGKTMGVLIGKPMAQGFKAGIKEMRTSLTDLKKEFGGLANKAKETFSYAATLGGAVSVGAMVQSAMHGQQAYTELGISLSKVTGETVTAAQTQKLIESAARRSRIEVDALVDAAGELKDVGVDKLEDSLVRSQMQAKRLQLDGGMIANIYKTLISKGLAESASQAEILVERIANIDDDKLNADIIREFSVQMGVAGGRAEQMLNVIENVSGGVKDFKAASEVVKQFGQSFGAQKGINDLTKAAGVSKIKIDQNATAFENFYDVVQGGGSKSQAVIAAFYKSFGNEKSQKMLEMLMGKELMIKITQGKADKLEMQEAAAKLKGLYTQQYDVEGEKLRIQKADAELLNTSEAKYTAAMNKLTEAFRSPKVLGAIEKLADKLPALADGIASLIEVVVDHPAESLASVVLARVGLSLGSSFISAGMQKAGEAGMKALFARLMVVQAATAAATAAGGTAGIGGALGLGGAAVGAKTAGAALATTGLAVAGAGLVGAGVGYGIYKGGMEGKQNAEFDARRTATQAVTDAGFAKSPEQIREALGKLQAARTGMNKSQSLTNTIFGKAASVLTGEKDPETQRAESDQAISRAQEQLIKQLELLRMASSTAAGALRQVGDTGTSRGPMRPADPAPGARPTGG